jgi:hypothetical protein
LNGEYADTSGRSVDQNFLSRLNVCFSQEAQRRESAEQDGGGFVKRHVDWFQRQYAAFGNASILSISAELESGATEYFVAGAEFSNGLA